MLYSQYRNSRIKETRYFIQCVHKRKNGDGKIIQNTYYPSSNLKYTDNIGKFNYSTFKGDANVYKNKTYIWKLMSNNDKFESVRIFKTINKRISTLVWRVEEKDITEEFIFNEKINLI